jgi:hypothetical protein
VLDHCVVVERREYGDQREQKEREEQEQCEEDASDDGERDHGEYQRADRDESAQCPHRAPPVSMRAVGSG